MDVSFLTPLDALFGLAAAVPLAALLLTERRSSRVRAALSLATPRRRAFVPVVVSLALLPALVGVAAAQPVVVRRQLLPERADAQAFFVFDTSKSMSARTAPGAPTRLARAKREALRAAPRAHRRAGRDRLDDRPDAAGADADDRRRALRPHARPVDRDRPAAAEPAVPRPRDDVRGAPAARGRALLLARRHAPAARRLHATASRAASPPTVRYTIQLDQLSSPIFVHVWSPQERIYVHGRVDRGYAPDPTSGQALAQFAALAHGRVFDETQIGQAAAALRAAAGTGTSTDRRLGLCADRARAVVRARRRPAARLPALAPQPLVLSRSPSACGSCSTVASCS